LLTGNAISGEKGRTITNVLGVDESGNEQQQKDQPTAPDDGKDRKSTRLNSSHVKISYAVFCLKKKKKKKQNINIIISKLQLHTIYFIYKTAPLLRINNNSIESNTSKIYSNMYVINNTTNCTIM